MWLIFEKLNHLTRCERGEHFKTFNQLRLKSLNHSKVTSRRVRTPNFEVRISKLHSDVQLVQKKLVESFYSFQVISGD